MSPRSWTHRATSGAQPYGVGQQEQRLEAPHGNSFPDFNCEGNFLRAIETLDGVYTMPLPRSALLMAKSAHTDGVSTYLAVSRS
jgi:hypothetical protein